MVETSPWKDILHAGTPPPLPPGIFGMATAFMGIALYLVLEINLLVFRRFKKRGSLYFWSILISSWGVCLHSVGYILQWWTPRSPWILNTACILCGWSMMVTCQSLVLYSRLHLVIRNHKVLRYVLFLIIFTAFCIEIPQWVTTWAATDTRLTVTRKWSPYDSIMVRVSQLAFLLQESLLSALYIWGTITVLAYNDKIEVNRVKWDLLYINTYLILVDVVILILAYTNEHFPKEPTQNFAYAFKLKVEFVVLNQLLAVTQHGSRNYEVADNRYLKGSKSNSTPRMPQRSAVSADSLSRRDERILVSPERGIDTGGRMKVEERVTAKRWNEKSSSHIGPSPPPTSMSFLPTSPSKAHSGATAKPSVGWYGSSEHLTI